MQVTFGELFGLLGTLVSIIAGVWVIVHQFTKLEGRVGRLEERMDRLERKFDEILLYLAPKFRRKKTKHLHRKQ